MVGAHTVAGWRGDACFKLQLRALCYIDAEAVAGGTGGSCLKLVVSARAHVRTHSISQECRRKQLELGRCLTLRDVYAHTRGVESAIGCLVGYV
jgi:hypothetical protein